MFDQGGLTRLDPTSRVRRDYHDSLIFGYLSDGSLNMLSRWLEYKGSSVPGNFAVY